MAGTNGRLPIDNNQVERLMKRIAIGRKNWLFIGYRTSQLRANLVGGAKTPTSLARLESEKGPLSAQSS